MKNTFKYATLYDPAKETYCTHASSHGLVMGPETAKRFADNTDDCAVTVCCITYKHEDYIRQALDSFLMQKTTFKFKVFVGEDCGPDSTADIVREYAEKYPDIIVPFIREKNMGAQRNLIDLCQRATSPYIAFCEGDDYWIDEYKLQKQFEYMEEHPDIRICYTRTEILAPEDWFLRSWFKENKEGKLIFPECEPAYTSEKDSLTCFDCVWVFPAHTSTHFYRWNYDLQIPDWYYTGIIGDHPIFLMQLGEGKAGFIPDVTSVYRRSDVGVYMSDNRDEFFLKTRLDHVRWMFGILGWYKENQLRYPKVEFENRIKQEACNYLLTALKMEDQGSILKFFTLYPEASQISLSAYLSFYNDGKKLIGACTWKGYKLITGKKRYRLLLRPYGWLVRFAEKSKDLLKNVMKKVLKICKKIASFVCYWFYSFIPKRKNLWAITSFRSKGYLDNAKYFYEYILESHPEIDIFWMTKDEDVYQKLKVEGKPVHKFGSSEGRRLLSQAGVAVVDHNIMSDYDRTSGFNNKTKVVQLWHGVGFKAMGDGKKVKLVREPGVQYCDDILIKPEDGIFVKLKKKIKYFFCAPNRELFEKYFLLVCPGQERVNMVGKVWNIPQESMFMAGHPRNIMLYEAKPDAANPKILYAPTFRYNCGKEMELIDGCIQAFESIQKLMEKINGEFVIRLHPHTWRNYRTKLQNAANRFERITLDFEKDVYTVLGNYSIIISDYSSISLDFAMLDRPAIYHCPDYDWFVENEAGFNLDFPSVIPGPMTKNWDETLQKVLEYHENPQKDAQLRKEKLTYFFDESVNGPDNSERIVAEIKRRLDLK